MSNHIIETDTVRWKFGWERKYLSFFLEKVDKTLPRGKNLVFSVGHQPRALHAIEDLFVVAEMVGLAIPYDTRLKLHHDKDCERPTYYVLHYEDEFVSGLRTDSLGQAEELQAALRQARSDKPLLIQRIIENK